LQIARIVGQAKLRRNRELRDYLNAAQELRKRGYVALVADVDPIYRVNGRFRQWRRTASDPYA